MTPTTPELLPCPFCGNDACESIKENDHGINRYGVYCVYCDCELDEYKTKEEAISAWNTRVFPKWLREKIDNLYLDYDASVCKSWNDALDEVLSLTPEDKK